VRPFRVAHEAKASYCEVLIADWRLSTNDYSVIARHAGRGALESSPKADSCLIDVVRPFRVAHEAKASYYEELTSSWWLTGYKRARLT